MDDYIVKGRLEVGDQVFLTLPAMRDTHGLTDLNGCEIKSIDGNRLKIDGPEGTVCVDRRYFCLIGGLDHLGDPCPICGYREPKQDVICP